MFILHFGGKCGKIRMIYYYAGHNHKAIIEMVWRK